MQSPAVGGETMWPGGRLLLALCLLGLSGCGEGITEPTYNPGYRNVPEVVEVQTTTLRQTPGGCEVEVTYTNTSDRTVSVGFTYRALDASGRELGSLHTPVQVTGPGQTKTIMSGSTTAGPSGIPCASIASLRLKGVAAITGS